VIFLFQVTIYSIPYALTLYLQYVHELEPREAGFILMLQAICTVCTTVFTPRLVARFSYASVIYTGLATGLAAVMVLALITLSPSLYLPLLAPVLAGIAAGLIETPLTSLMMGSVSQSERGSATATMFTMCMLGAFSSVGIISFLLSLYLGEVVISRTNSDQLISAIGSYFALSTLTVLAALVCFRFTVRAHRRSRT
jgi:MFS family permease